jgi:hypothetical protein
MPQWNVPSDAIACEHTLAALLSITDGELDMIIWVTFTSASKSCLALPQACSTFHKIASSYIPRTTVDKEASSRG